MSKSPNLTLLVAPETRARMEQIKSVAGLPFVAQVEQALDLLHARMFPVDEPIIVLGYLRVDRAGDLDDDAMCAECGYALGARGLWLRMTNDGKSFGPLCADCASSE